MGCLVIYSTKTNNTPKIAKVIAKVLKCKAKMVSNTKVSELKQYNLLGFGSGIYAWRHSQQLLRFVDSANLDGKKVFIFSTSGLGWKWQHFSLRKKLRQKHASIIGEFACKGHDRFKLIRWLNLNKGRPDKRDIENAKKFAKDLKELVK